MPRGFTDYDTAKLQGRLWTPAVLRPAAWFDASDLGTITIETGVSQWNDKSGNERHATQATTAKQPEYTAMSARGTPRIKYNGGQALDVGGAAFPLTFMFTVCQTNETSFPLYQSVMWSGGSPNIYPLYGAQSSTNIGGEIPSQGTSTARYVVNGGAISVTNRASFVPMEELKIVSSIGASASASRSNWQIGFGDPSLNYWKGDINEIIVPNGSISVLERNLFEGYLSWKWGIRLAADHPYANRPPLIGD